VSRPFACHRARPRPALAPNALAAVATIAAVAAMAAGCAFLAPRPDPSRFYVLTSDATGEGSPVAGSFGVGPISIPDYLKRASIVTRTTANEITPSSVDRWGESLDGAIPRILQENLRRLLGNDRVILFPWYATNRPDVQIVVHVLRFERDANGTVTLLARWEIKRAETGALVRGGETSTVRNPSGSGTDGSVAAQSEALAVLSEDIANALRALPPAVRTDARPGA